MNMTIFSKLSTIALSTFILAAAGISDADACTGIKLVAKDGSNVHGRTLEFGIKVDTSAVVIPRGYAFLSTTPNGKGLEYTSKYGVVGSIAFDNLAVMDGMNEKGLYVGTFYFPGFAEYAKITPENQSKALSPIEFPNWIVTQFATVEEVKQALSNVFIAPTVVKAWGNEPAPFHYLVFDKSGKGLVIEPIGGKLVTYDNPLGTFTNSPTFDWHMTNLRNYINLRTNNVPPLKVANMVLTPFGQGSGMVGLPGDFTPPSRFVRAAIFSYTAIPSDNAEKAVYQAFHILNQFDIPIGLAKDVTDGIVHTDYTIVTAVCDPQALMYYFRTYDDQAIRSVDIKKFDLNAKAVKKAAVTGFQKAVDISADLK